jgi:DNA modification methylase
VLGYRNCSSRNGHTATPLKIHFNEYLVDDARRLKNIFGRKPFIDATVTSPPYWDAKNYGVKGQIGYGQSLEQYLNDLTTVFAEVWHCTKQTGSLWVVMNTIKKDNTFHLLPLKLAEKLSEQPQAAWHLQDVLIWVKPHTLPWSHRQKLQDHFEYILCFSKSRSFSLNLDELRSTQSLANWWVKYPERYHPSGKGVNNVWEIPIPTQGSWGNGSIEHACPLPTELTKRIIKLSTDRNGVVFDPFAGTGATVVAARDLGRKWLAIDINSQYRSMCHKRLAEEGTLPGHKAVDASTLRDANLKLRQLKFPVLLYKRLAPGLRLTVNDIPLLVVKRGTNQRRPAPNWVTNCQIVIALRDGIKTKRARELAQGIEQHLLIPPLSKFQVEADVRAMQIEELGITRLFPNEGKLSVYTCGHFWQAAKRVPAESVTTLPNKSIFPLLVSDINIDEQPAY